MNARQTIVGPLLVALLAIPGYLLGQKLRHGDPSVLALAALTLMVVLVAGAIMRQLD